MRTRPIMEIERRVVKKFNMAERGIRMKFRYSRSDKSKSFIQFSSRIRSYLNK